MVSLLCYFLCSITIVAASTVATEAAWNGRHGDGSGWRDGTATSPYYGWYGYDDPYCAGLAVVVRLTGGYGYAPNYSYGYEYRYTYSPYVRRQFHVAARSVRRVRDYSSATAASSLGAATTRAPSSPSKAAPAAPADSASLRNVWTPMTVSISPSPTNEPPKTDVDSTEWAKKFELKLNQLWPDMWAASALLGQEGFRVDSGNKSATGWFLTAHDKNRRRGSIKLQSDGTKIVLTATG